MPIFMNLILLEQYCTVYAMPIRLFSMSIFRLLLHLPHFYPSPHIYLHILAHHGNHEIEQANSLNESETQNGV
jgi:hypothetical protein